MADQRMKSKTVRFAIDEAEEPKSPSAGAKSRPQSVSESSEKTVRSADKHVGHPDPSFRFATHSVRSGIDNVQNLGPSSATNTVFSLKMSDASHKKVRFAEDKDIGILPDPLPTHTHSSRFASDDVEKSEHAAVIASPDMPGTGTTSNKRVRFVVDHGEPSLDSTSTQNTHTSPIPEPSAQPPYYSTTLLDADISLKTPLEGPDSPFLIVTTSQSIASTSNSLGSEYSASPQQPRLSPSAIPLDPGETDADGHVLAPRIGPCEKRSGRIVWATKGEWLLVCEGCGEPQ
ncbi:hypothetical protein IQ06DRAFT_360765 [Phaeosphaeriaceae sp. SRC1lsM3a]|nr:hypothetical protein IQ06DRAFT_360765 [Stagonospora sp. SRC1lsM3a]